ncbi:leucyl/phenylalanyl-tRNA--protein transferase [Pseudidiomarina homiensis]|uniref:Leucyl/phenylalanyl-tRNA--protein transferase n=1 Tax=Pseudidiomarina homiensis TaxID=364198 RepID=A0A432Y3Y3_9GAMM|nr:leucyl/phenylalanyl-tRNA--protein transferase [Pseudidiomarina homiensis]RUO55663.1 leucyl/phenylalanyl-tRNA--protein transferase [Pseudidiomarina homiensis]
MVYRLAAQDTSFPPAELALREPNGLLAVGGDLSVARLLNAYRNGIFPWFTDDDPPLWWSPDPRALFTPASLHESRSMRRFRRRTPLRVTLNHDFAGVIRRCAEVHASQEGTWITAAMQDAYLQLHALGYAHSVEVWDQTTLVGGMYGVAIDGIFCGESMFHCSANASKLAFLSFAENFFAAGGKLLDAQVPNAHLVSLGQIEMPRAQFLYLVRHFRENQRSVSPDFWKPRVLNHKSSGNL